MAFKQKHIINPKVGIEITFLQTTKDTLGEILEMQATYQPHSHEPPAHYHPYQTETFTILEGELTIRLEDNLKVLSAKDVIVIDPNTIHSMWNNSDQKTIVNWKVTPALETEYMLELLYGLSSNNKTDKYGRPSLLQTALMMRKFDSVFRLPKPPRLLQLIVFSLLTPLSYLLGYKPLYKKYID